MDAEHEGLVRSEARLRRAEELVGVGSWELSLDGAVLTASDGFRRIHGLRPGDGHDLEAYVAMVHAEDRDLVRESVSRCALEGLASAEYRITRPDGAVRTLRNEGELVASGGPQESYLRGAVIDVTDERAGFDAAPMGMLVTEPVRLGLVRVNDALCTMFGREREELLGLRVDDLTHPDDLALVTTSREALLAGTMGTWQGEKRYVRPDGGVIWAAFYVTPVHNTDGSIREFSTQLVDITETKKRGAEMQAARLESLRTLAIASEYRDDDTHEHTERVGCMAEAIGRMLGSAAPPVDLLRQAAPLHDIGKIGISDAILLKPGKLTAEEREAMERHTLIGADILSESNSEVLQMAEQIALAHHERWDGTGYPKGLRGQSIPLAGRIVAIADVFDALTHSRPYKEAWSVGRAVAHIEGESGGQFDPGLVAAFASLDHAALASQERDNQTQPRSVRALSLVSARARGRALAPPESAEEVLDRGLAAADRDSAASDRDHTAAARDRSEAEADQRTSDRDQAASDRDRAATERDQRASERDRSAAQADGQTADREQAASERDHAASDRDQIATVRDQTQTDADAQRADAPTATPRTSQAGVQRRSNHRGEAADDRERAASDRIHTALDRDQSDKEAYRRTFNRNDAADDREHAVADRASTAQDRDQSEAEAGQRTLDRDEAAADRLLAAADRDQGASDRRTVTNELDQSRRELRRAQVDQLTGAMGRELGTIALERAIERARHGDRRLTLARVDVRGLRRVNERQGHAAGDALLRELVGAMQMHLHADDPIVRVSGNDFVCALHDSDPEDACRRFEAIQKTIGHYHHGGSASVGFAALLPGDTLRQLAERADIALREVKRGGEPSALAAGAS